MIWKLIGGLKESLVQSIVLEKSWQPGLKTTGLRKQRVMNAGVQLSVFTIQGRPAQIMLPSTFTMGLLTSINAPYKLL